MAKPEKPTATDRTLGMFTKLTPIEEREIEVIQEEVSGERIPVEEGADGMREAAFRGQEWTSKYFGSYEAPGNEYRMSRKGEYYYLETILKEVGKPSAYGYTGVMVHRRDLLEFTKVCVAAVRALQAEETK